MTLTDSKQRVTMISQQKYLRDTLSDKLSQSAAPTSSFCRGLYSSIKSTGLGVTDTGSVFFSGCWETGGCGRSDGVMAASEAFSDWRLFFGGVPRRSKVSSKPLKNKAIYTFIIYLKLTQQLVTAESVTWDREIYIATLLVFGAQGQ